MRNPIIRQPEWLRSALGTQEPKIPGALEDAGILAVTDVLRPGNSGARLRGVVITSFVGPLAGTQLYWNTKGNSTQGAPTGDADALNYQALVQLSVRNSSPGALFFIWHEYYVADNALVYLKGINLSGSGSVAGPTDWSGKSEGHLLRPGSELMMSVPALAAGDTLTISIGHHIYPAGQIIDR